MRVDEFLVERWMNEYEHDVEVNLAETCVEPFTLRGFLEFVGREDFLEELMDIPLTYGNIEGNPELRDRISHLYKNVDSEDVLVTGGAIEANFNAFYSLVEPGDTIISSRKSSCPTNSRNPLSVKGSTQVSARLTSTLCSYSFIHLSTRNSSTLKYTHLDTMYYIDELTKFSYWWHKYFAVHPRGLITPG